MTDAATNRAAALPTAGDPPLDHSAPSPAARPSLAYIAERCAEVWDVRIGDMKSHGCARAVVCPRHCYYLLARQYTHHTHAVIARHMGGRDHSTVMRGVSKARDLEENNQVFRDGIAACRLAIEARGEPSCPHCGGAL